MKIKDYVQLWNSEKGNVFVFYNQFDMGAKYKVYRKVSYDGNIKSEYVIAFETLGEAITYAKKIYDVCVGETKFIATLRDDLYKVCLKHNIPVAPSDVQEIAEELAEIKTSKERYYNGKN